jgi:hypothetical protein
MAGVHGEKNFHFDHVHEQPGAAAAAAAVAAPLPHR